MNLSPEVLRREMLRILYNEGMIPDLDECRVIPLVDAFDTVRLVFQTQFIDITATDRCMSLDDVSAKIRANLIPITQFQSALARNVSALHSV